MYKRIKIKLIEQLKQYETGKQDTSDIVELAILLGFWSIWISVFQSHDIVVDELILNYNGTFQRCKNTNLNRR